MPRTKREYMRQADRNVDRLIDTLKDISLKTDIKSERVTQTPAVPVKQAGGSSWVYSSQKKSKPKTFKL